MSRLTLNPFGNICSVTLELSWEMAEALAEHGPAVLAAIKEAVRARKVEAKRKDQTRTETDKACDQNRADYAALARRCEAEIVRRSNGPGQRPVIVKQLAEELKLSVPYLNTICRVFTREEKQQGIARRKAEIIRLHLLSWTDKRIAQEVKLARETVSRILAGEQDLIKTLRAGAGDVRRLNDSPERVGGVQ
ncbi:MAG: hypothetical protein ACYCZX_13750 [Rhodospirillaceae bacterium]